MLKIVILLISLVLSLSSVSAEQNIKSYFGFEVSIPDDWFQVSPKNMAEANKNETIESLGLNDIAQNELMAEIMDRMKSENIEYFYDKKYLADKNKSNISVQVGAPIEYASIEALQTSVATQCDSIEEELQMVFQEKPTILSCQLVPSNGLPVIHHAYIINSLNVVIINESVPINSKYSLIFVGGAENELERIKRVRSTQQSLIDSFTNYLLESAK